MNVMCFVLSLAAVVTWLAQFFLRLRKNVLIREDIANGGWSSEGEATVGYSFWLVFIASIGTEQLIDTADQLSNRVIKTVIHMKVPLILLRFITQVQAQTLAGIMLPFHRHEISISDGSVGWI